MQQIRKTITDSQHEEVRTTEAGDKYLVLLVTYDDGADDRIVVPGQTVMPA